MLKLLGVCIACCRANTLHTHDEQHQRLNSAIHLLSSRICLCDGRYDDENQEFGEVADLPADGCFPDTRAPVKRRSPLKLPIILTTTPVLAAAILRNAKYLLRKKDL
ncbi:hypothetical protein ABZP36_036241 [Zizania latifolia]